MTTIQTFDPELQPGVTGQQLRATRRPRHAILGFITESGSNTPDQESFRTRAEPESSFTVRSSLVYDQLEETFQLHGRVSTEVSSDVRHHQLHL